MLILYIAIGAFVLGGGILLLNSISEQRSSRKWY
jgi:hypothetical protein